MTALGTDGRIDVPMIAAEAFGVLATGRQITPFSSRHPDVQSTTEEQLLAWSSNKIAGYKRPKSVAFIREEEMPRTATGKILHQVLGKRYGAAPPLSESRSGPVEEFAFPGSVEVQTL